jgi:hypothetical protein
LVEEHPVALIVSRTICQNDHGERVDCDGILCGGCHRIKQSIVGWLSRDLVMKNEANVSIDGCLRVIGWRRPLRRFGADDK